jgi:hypothetical protein
VAGYRPKPPDAFLLDGRSTAARDITTRFPTSLRLAKAWLVRDCTGGGDCPQLRAGKGDKARRHDDDMAAAAPEAGAAAGYKNGFYKNGLVGDGVEPIALIPATVALRGSLRRV